MLMLLNTALQPGNWNWKKESYSLYSGLNLGPACYAGIKHSTTQLPFLVLSQSANKYEYHDGLLKTVMPLKGSHFYLTNNELS
jgi:hypothetical protein